MIRPLITKPAVYKMEPKELLQYKKHILKYKEYILHHNSPWEPRVPYVEKCKREFHRILRRQKNLHDLITKILARSREFDRTYVPIK